MFFHNFEVIFDWLYYGCQKWRPPPQHLVPHHHPTGVEKLEHLRQERATELAHWVFQTHLALEKLQLTEGLLLLLVHAAVLEKGVEEEN